jgi:hypothetical protein
MADFIGQDDELRRPAVVISAKAHDVNLSHSGRENSEKRRGEQGAMTCKEIEEKENEVITLCTTPVDCGHSLIVT